MIFIVLVLEGYHIPKLVWDTKREDIAKATHELGNIFPTELSNGWVHYLESFGERQGVCKRADPAVPNQKVVVNADDEPG